MKKITSLLVIAATLLFISCCKPEVPYIEASPCLLYTSDAADDLLCVDLGGRRIIKKKNNKQ
mgnify:CR=1 FL=1